MYVHSIFVFSCFLMLFLTDIKVRRILVCLAIVAIKQKITKESVLMYLTYLLCYLSSIL